MIRTLLRLCLAALLAMPLLAGGRPLRIAAASDLKWALEEVRRAFEVKHPEITCTLTFGASGALFAQASQQAPFDLFLSADLGYPDQLVARGLAHPEGRFTYALGHLVVWVPSGSAIPVEATGLRAVLHPSVRRIALANPKVAPYGRAAEAALRGAGLLAEVQSRLVFGENLAQAAQFVQSGQAEVGLISRSLATSPAMAAQGRFAAVPEGLHPPLEQGGVILAWARDRAAAQAFRDYLLGPEGSAILARFGCAKPGAR